jgi:hypothetical protein
VIDLSSSSDEKDLIAATSHALSSPKDSLVSSTALSWGRPMTARSSSSATIMKKVHEEKPTGTEDAAASGAVNPASTASIDADDAPMWAKNNNSDDQGPDQEAGSDADEP